MCESLSINVKTEVKINDKAVFVMDMQCFITAEGWMQDQPCPCLFPDNSFTTTEYQ